MENGSSFGRRQRWGIEAPTKTHLVKIMMIMVVLREVARVDLEGGDEDDKGEGGDDDDSPTQEAACWLPCRARRTSGS